MIRSVRADGSIENGGAFAPIVRRRLVARIEEAALQPIALIVAPAGFGKSVALSQYLAQLDAPYVRFNLGPEHGELLGFLRGLAESLAAVAPHLLATLAGAYQRTQSLESQEARCTSFALWVHAHVKEFAGLMIVDDLQIAEKDRDVARFLVELIGLTKGRLHWLISSRSTVGLPIGTWLAYGDSELAVDETDLSFTLDEARETAQRLGLHMRDRELQDLLGLTGGWPAGMSFALRASVRSADLRKVSALTREMIYRFLAEQVYEGFDRDERALLETAMALPAIDVELLEFAGFDDARQTVERLCTRTAFLHEEVPGVYRCHDLFADFLRHQGSLAGKKACDAAHRRAAVALESRGDVPHALSAYVRAGASDDVLRLLIAHGEALLHRAGADVVAAAIASLDEKVRREHAHVLAIRGALESAAGKTVRAEALLRRSLAAQADPARAAATALNLARLIVNRQGDASDVLALVVSATSQPDALRAEAYSLLAAQRAMERDRAAAGEAIAAARSLLTKLDDDESRAKVLHRLGVAAAGSGEVDRAYEALVESAQLAENLHLYALAGRACAALSNLMGQERDDLGQRLWYAQQAVAAATKAGDVRDLQLALVQVLGALTRRGEAERCAEVEREIARLSGGDDAFAAYVMQFRAIRLAWEGRFGEAHRLLARCWQRLHSESDRSVTAAFCALFLAADGLRDSAIEMAERASNGVASEPGENAYRMRNAASTIALCALAEAVNGRVTQADRLARRLVPYGDAVARSLRACLQAAIVHLRVPTSEPAEAQAAGVADLRALGYSDVANVLAAVFQRLERESGTDERAVLTPAEREVLQLLGQGLRPKEIAAQTGRSVHTVRAHVANAVAKLHCHGRAEAVVVAQRRGLL